MRVPRMNMLGLEFAATTRSSSWPDRSTTTAWRCWCSPGWSMWRIVHSPFGLHLRAIRDNAQQGRVSRRARAPVPAGRVRDLGGLSAPSAAPSSASASASPIPSWCTGPIPGHLVFMTVLGGFSQLLRADRRRAGVHAAAGPAAVAHAVLALCAGRDPGADRDLLPGRIVGLGDELRRRLGGFPRNELSARSKLGLLPLPQGEGWGERSVFDDLSKSCNPSPPPSPKWREGPTSPRRRCASISSEHALTRGAA